MSMAQNAAPIADAGKNQEVASGAMVRLDGRGSSARDGGTIVSYHWARTGGSSGNTLVLTGEDTARPTFTADRLFPGTDDVTHEFTLTVTDDLGTSSTDMVTVTINSPNAVPVADAGDDQTVVSGATVTLDGSDSSDGDGMVASYRWRRTGGTGNSGVVLTGANTARLSFTADTLAADVDGVTHVFELVVTDDEDAESVADTVTVTVTAGNAGNAPPVADAGGGSTRESSSGVLTVASGAMVRLDGRGSSARDGGTIVSYHWARTGGSGDRNIVLTGAGTARPTFTAETLAPDSPDRTHVFTLTVTDDLGATSTDRVWVLVSSPIGIPLHCHHHNPIGYPVFPPNKRPIADAGPDHTVSRPMTVILDGSDSYDPDGTIVAYQWYQWTSDDRDLLFRHGGNSSTPRFSLKVAPPGPGKDDWIQYFCLVVWDNLGVKSWGDTVTITATSRINADAGPDQTVASGATVELDGSGSTADPRRTIASYAWARTGGTGSSVSLSSTSVAQPTFTADNLVAGAADVTHVFKLTVTDSARDSDSDSVTVTVTSGFAAPNAIIAGGNRELASGATVELDGSGSTFDSRATVTYAWARTGGDGDATVALTGEDTARLSFTTETRDAGAPDVTHEFTLTVTDNKGGRSTDTVMITVKAPPFDGLVAEAGPAQDDVASGTPVTLDGTGSTLTGGGRNVTYLWTQTGGDAATVTLTGDTTLAPSFTAQTLTAGDADVTYVFTLRVSDDKGTTAATDTVMITVKAPPFDGLVAEAGPAQDDVASGTPVTLDGTGSTLTGGGRNVTYLWTQTGGDAATVTLTGDTTLAPSFTAQTLTAGDADVTYVFTLRVSDDKGTTAATDTVMITVKAPPFDGLVAEAGPAQDDVASGTPVTLDGTGSTLTGGGRNVTYLWTQTGGDAATVTLTGDTTLAPSFTAQTLTAGDADVTYVFTLRVSDDKGTTAATDTVMITVKAPPFDGLVAEAGPAQDDVASGTPVTLDGTGSTLTGGGRNVTYLWTQTGGDAATVTLTGDTTLAPSFTAQTLTAGDADVTYVFTLRVSDDKGTTAATDTVMITVKAPPFDGLVAEAGPAQDDVASGTPVTLDGTGSTLTGGGRNVTYLWTQTGGDAATVTLTGDTTLAPSFTAQTLTAGDADVTYVFTLRVSDDKGTTAATDTVMITVKAPPFDGLVAEAGPAQDDVASGTPVTLDGTGSTLTGGGRNVTYLWTQTGGDAATVTLTGDTTLAPSFTAQTLTAGDADVTYVFTLRVSDDKGTTAATDTVMITVKAPPFDGLVAEAGPAQDDVASGTPVTLDGTGSTLTGGGRNVTYLWTQTGGDAATVTLTGDTTLAPSFTAQTLTAGDADVTYVFTLRVSDDKGTTAATDTVMITVKAPPFDGLVAEAGPAQDDVASGTPVTLDGTGSTLTGGGRNVTYLWTQTGGDAATVTLTGDTTLAPSFTAQTLTAGDADVTYVFTLRVSDDKGTTAATDTVMITVKAPPFDGLVAEAGPAQDDVASGTPVTLDGTGSTLTGGGRNVTYLWTQTGGDAATVTLTGDTTLAPSFTAQTLTAGDADVTYVFTLRVSDDKGTTAATDTVMITVKAPPFDGLVAEAGPAQDDVASGTPVTLDGTGSTLTGGGRNVTYLWTQTGGDAATVTLTGDTTLAPSFTAQTLTAGDADVTYVFTLRVSDDKGTTAATDTVMITVKAPPFDGLVAEAGPAQDDVASGTPVTLDGTGSTLTGGGRNVTYLWTQTGGDAATVTLTGDTTLAPSFTAQTLTAGDADVTYVFTLRVSDDKGTTAATDTVMITVKAPPFDGIVAEAGPAQDDVASGTPVTLDGTGSTLTGGGRNVTYLWTQTGGDAATVTLTGDTTLAPSFTAQTLTAGDADVTYVFTLRVSDDKGTTAATDTVMITVKAPPFDGLVAEAGPAQDDIASGTPVTLDGTGSTLTGGGRNVTYLWTQTGGDAATVTLTGDTTLAPSFTAQTLTAGDADVTYVFTLRVSDDKGTTAATDTVMITVKAPPFDGLVAEAGPAQDDVASGTPVTLDGTGSTLTGGGRNVTYLWTQTGGDAATVTLTGDTTLAPSFTAQTLTAGDADVTYVFTLRVSDDKGTTAATDTVMITVKAPPFDGLVAEAGPAQDDVASGTPVTLDGTGSTLTGGGRNVTYLWTQTGGDAATVTLTGDTTLAPSFMAQTLTAGDADVTYVFTLRVSDDKGTTAATDTVMITVKAPPFDGLVAEAGPAQDDIASGTPVTLDGTGSTLTGGGRNVTYLWTQTGGDAATVTLTGDTTLASSFTAQTLTAGDADVTYVFTLRVSDDKGTTAATDTVMITVKAPPFDGLVAEAGPAQDDVASGTPVTLDGTGSTLTGGGRNVTYLWTQTGGDAATVTLTGDTTLAPSFTAQTLTAGDADVTYVFTLRVSDDKGTTAATDTVMVTVKAKAPNAPPVADAGEDQEVASGTTVTLDGSGSTARDGGTVASYFWRRTGGTGGDIVVLADENAPQMRFTADTLAPGADDVTHVFELTVTDNEGAVSEPDTVTVTVLAVPLQEVGILASPSELTVQEGGSSAYQVRLSRSPGQEVTIEAVSDNKDVVLNNAHLLFNAENWGAWQNVSISTVADTDKADDKALIRHTFVRSGVAVDQSGVVSVTVREVDPILSPVGEYLAAHATALLNNQRKLILFLKQDGTIPGGSNEFTFNATNGRLALNGGFVRDGIWGEVTGSNTRSEFGDTSSVLGSFGLHWKNSERFLTGVMLQFYLAEHDLAGGTGSIDGAGWLAGPYFASRHGTQPLYYEGRVLYGQSDNDIRFNGPDLRERRGSFDTRRLLAQLRMEGEIVLEDGDYGPRLIPYADALWIKERAKGFTDSVGNRVPGQKVGVGHLEFGSNLEIPIVTAHGAMTFIGGLGVVYSNTESDYIRSESRGRGRVEMGFSYNRDDNVRIDFESYYDGIGTSKYESYGLKLVAKLKF